MSRENLQSRYELRKGELVGLYNSVIQLHNRLEVARADLLEIVAIANEYNGIEMGLKWAECSIENDFKANWLTRTEFISLSTYLENVNHLVHLMKNGLW